MLIEILSKLYPSVVRTASPIVVGWLLSVLPAWLGLTEDQLGTIVAGALGVLYYVLVRVLEQFSPRFGWLIGLPGEPAYDGKHEL